ncbi:amino acid adenylation domain-containing protein [Nonomuraea sp. NPDC050786]|uniref:amino acid adenylation domain-containing protein n=1 Tax=Nonomuraea sp. NPDC050786 TaxID=3154840 RepID=UPI0033D86F53
MTGTQGLHELVGAQVAKRPDHCAIVDDRGRSLTYQELWVESGRVAEALAAKGVGRSDGVALALDRSIELAVAMLAVARSGAWYVPLDPYAPPARHQYVIKETNARVMIDAAGQPNRTVTGPGVRISLPLDEGGVVTAPVRGGHRTNPEDTLYVTYTSGSTGRPKGVVVPHRAARAFLETTRLCQLTERDRIAWVTNPASDALTLEVWGSLMTGGTVVVLPLIAEVGIDAWLAKMRGAGVTVMFLMTPLFELIAREDSSAFASLDTLIFGGDAANIELVRQVCANAPPLRLMQGYGPTETTVFTTYFDCTTTSLADCDRVPLGYPLERYTVQLLDNAGELVRPGEIGELYIGGPGVASGYFAQEELTAQKFVRRDGDDSSLMYRSGDLARQRADGAYEFVGRLDRQVKIRGFRVDLEEVERVILATGLAIVAVVEKSGEGQSGHLVCYYVPRYDRHLADPVAFALEASKAMTAELPGYMIPARWIPRTNIPLTGNGKIDRKHLTTSVKVTSTTRAISCNADQAGLDDTGREHAR